jgi:hypothetical protein
MKAQADEARKRRNEEFEQRAKTNPKVPKLEANYEETEEEQQRKLQLEQKFLQKAAPPKKKTKKQKLSFV